jgi:hypothetical protein
MKIQLGNTSIQYIPNEHGGACRDHEEGIIDPELRTSAHCSIEVPPENL